MSSASPIPSAGSDATAAVNMPAAAAPTIQEVKEKPVINVVLLGHPEAGKSTVTGHLLCKLGALDKRVVERCEREASEANKRSSRFAWVRGKPFSCSTLLHLPNKCPRVCDSTPRCPPSMCKCFRIIQFKNCRQNSSVYNHLAVVKVSNNPQCFEAVSIRSCSMKQMSMPVHIDFNCRATPVSGCGVCAASTTIVVQNCSTLCSGADQVYDIRTVSLFFRLAERY